MYKELVNLINKNRHISVDASNYKFKTTKWLIGNSSIWLYQETRDSLNGTELSISFIKNSSSKPLLIDISIKFLKNLNFRP